MGREERAMSGELAWFPMTAAQATAVQQSCAEAMGLLLVEQLELGEGKAFELVLIPTGEFLMGGQDDDSGGAPRQVRFQRPFYLSRYPVTQAQWTAVMDTNPAHFRDCPDCPIENVAWEAIVAFCAQA
jgi:formylglycine-generating enzyme required for sulfatase activity